MLKNLALFIIAFFSLSFVNAQNLETKQYICTWKVIRTEKEPNFAPYTQSASNGEKVPGLVAVNDDLVMYGRNKFLRSKSLPVQKRTNGTINVFYSNGEDMITMAYLPNNSVQIAIMMKAGVNLAGDCEKV